MSFINVFGGGTLQPTDVSYRAYNLSANLALVWPAFSQTGNDYVARINDVTPLAPGYTIAMPPANQISTGFDILWRNLGSTSFTVLDNSGSTLLTVPAGTMQLLYLTDNTTTHGAWGTIAFGAGSAALNVASVAGYGLQAVGALLQSSIATALVSATPFAISSTSLAQSFVWTGGVGTYSLPQVASVGNTFWFAVRNQGTGVLTIQPQASEFIDGLSSTTLQPGDSCLVLAGVSANWYSVGRGRQDAFNFTELVQTVTGGTLTLSLTQAANVVQRYTGTLTANQTIVVPAVVQVYYVQNATSGNFTLTIQSPTPGTVISVPSGQNAILFCDGTNIINATTTVSGLTSITLNQGSAASPSFNFSGDLSTGFFQPLSHAIAASINGTEVGRWTAAGYNGVIGGTTPAAATVTSLGMSGPLTGLTSLNGNPYNYYNPAGVAITGGTINGITQLNGNPYNYYNPAGVAITGGTINGITQLNGNPYNYYNPAAVGITGGLITVPTYYIGSASQSLGTNAYWGLTLNGKTGSNSDFALFDPSYTTPYFSVPTGTHDVDFSATVVAATFSGAGTGLTGTAASLSIGGSAASAITAGGKSIFTSNGTWTAPAGVTQIKIYGITPGNGGVNGSLSVNGGAGGNAGVLYGPAILTVSPGTAYPVTIAGGAIATAGVAGFGSLLSVTTPTSGIVNGAGGATNTSLNSGNPGTGVQFAGGAGGAGNGSIGGGSGGGGSLYAPGGAGSSFSGGYSGGGGGGAGYLAGQNSPPSVAGGVGGAGLMVIEW